MNQARPHLAEELEELKRQLLTMGGLAEERLTSALDALVAADRQLLMDVVTGDSRINDLQIDIDQRCLTLFALYQPVAHDLRLVVSGLHINADLERVGDLAVNISEAALRYLQHPPVKPLIDLPRMGRLAVAMLHEALAALVARDVSLAQNVLRHDEWLDALREQILRELLTFMLGDPRTIEPALELILISRHIERVGDHATNIAEDVIFIVEARDIRHRSGHLTRPASAGGPGPRPVERRRTFPPPPF